MLSQITLARDEAQRISAFSGIRKNYRHRFRLINRLGISYFILCIISHYFIDVLYLMNWIYSDPETRRYAVYVTTFLLVQVVGHWLLMRFTSRWDNVKRSRIMNYQLPSHASGPWRSCHDCGRTCPPRSYHCPVCRCCVLKRDHHCFLTGVCVGYHNQRHFIIMSFYCAISTVTFLTHLYTYFLSQNVDMLSIDVCKLFLPVTLVRYFTDSLGLDVCLLTMALYVNLGCLGAALLTLVQQIYYTLSGRTAYEVKKRRREYSQSAWNNCLSVFGKSGPVLFLIPLPVPYHGDGFSWKYQHKFRIEP